MADECAQVAQLLTSAGVPGELASALSQALSHLVEASVCRAFGAQMEDVRSIVAGTEAVMIAQVEQILVNQDMAATRAPAPARAAPAKPRINTWFAQKFVSSEFRAQFADAIPAGAGGGGSAADWKRIGQEVYSAISKKGSPHAHLLKAAREMLQAEAEADVDGPLPPPDDASETASVASDAPEKIPAHEAEPEPPKPKKSAKKSAAKKH